METLKKYARFMYVKRSFTNEWGFFIALILILQIVAMSFSIFAGYFFFYDLFKSMIGRNWVAIALTILNLTLIEALTMLLLSKFFKFIMRKEVKNAVTAIVLACSLYSVSFISSTNGLAMRQSRIIDKSSIINKDFDTHISALRAAYQVQSDEINKQIQINLSNPLGWAGRKQDRLTLKQLERIDVCYKDLKKLSEDFKKDKAALEVQQRITLASNNIKVRAEAYKYHAIVALVMVFIFVINGVLMYFFSKIYKEEDPDEDNQVSKLLKDVETKTAALAGLQKSLDEHFKTTRVATQAPKDPNLCMYCGKPLERTGLHQKFCNSECRQNYWVLKKVK